MNAWDDIRSQGVIAIVRSVSADAALETTRTLLGAGIAAVEVSLSTPGALDVVRQVAAEASDGTSIGVGTVVTAADVETAAAAGARFLVAPICDHRSIRAACEAGLDILPGVATPTEAVSAMEAGARAVKLFPASLWTPALLREMRIVLPWLRVVPTGGVTIDTASGWIAAGAVAVGIGAALSGAADLPRTAQTLLAAIRTAREAVPGV